MICKTVELPGFDVNDEEAVITEIYVNNREKIEAGRKLFSVENTKAVNEIEAVDSGYILIACRKFETKRTGDKLAFLFESLEELEQFERNSYKQQEEESVNATKKALDLAEQLNVDIKKVAAAKNGDVVKEKDVRLFFDQRGGKKKKSNVQKHVFKYDRERVVIAGAGDGAEVVIDILRDDYEKEIVGLIDDRVKKLKNYNYKVYECGIFAFPEQADRHEFDTVIISIGASLKSMQLRKVIFDRYTEEGLKFTNAVAKSADIRRGVKIGTGNLIGAQSYIGTLTEIGDNNSISYGTFIGHHNRIGNHNLIAPGFVSSGAVEIGSSCIFPAGIVTRNCVCIGDNVVLPVGYAVVNSIERDTIIQQQLVNGN